jgi:transposase
MRYELSDYEWTAIKPMLPNKPRGIRRVNDRRVLNGVFWVLRSGAPWRDLPETYGPRTTCYNRFVRWRQAGVWDQIMDALAAGHDAAVQMIDTSIVRVHQHGACIADNNHQDMGRSRGGLTSNIHAVVDSNGLAVHLALTPGEAHDNRLCEVLLSALLPQAMLLADRGYDADWIREFARQQGAWANIPPKRNRKEPICFSPYLYRARNLIERFFNKIKQCRRVAARYDKLAANYLALSNSHQSGYGSPLWVRVLARQRWREHEVDAGFDSGRMRIARPKIMFGQQAERESRFSSGAIAFWFVTGNSTAAGRAYDSIGPKQRSGRASGPVFPLPHGRCRFSNAADLDQRSRAGGSSSDTQSHFHAGFFKPVLEGGELVGKFAQFAVFEFRENELVQGLLLRGQIRQMLISLVGQGHLHDPGILGRRLAAYKALLFQQFRLSCDK